jgi:type 1 fimbria pilin
MSVKVKTGLLALLKRLQNLALMAVFLLFACHSHATLSCSNYSAITIPIPTINIQDFNSLPINSKLSLPLSTSGYGGFYRCTADGTTVSSTVFQLTSLLQPVTVIDGKQIFATNNKGIGMYIYSNPTTPREYCIKDSTGIPAGEKSATICSWDHLPTSTINAAVTIELYKILDKIPAEPLQPLIIAQHVATINNQESAYSTVKISGGNVISGTCNVLATSINVNLPTVYNTSFKEVGQSTTDSSLTNFEIPLSCQKDTVVKIQINGKTYDWSKGMLSLDTNSNSASGVAIQLLHKDTPIKIGQYFNTGTTSSAGNFKIPLTARYIKTQNIVKPGVANSTATFILKYN